MIPVVSSTLVFFVSALYLSPSDLGLFSLASSIVMTVIALSPIAFGEALVQRQSISQSYADSVFWMTMGVGAILFTPFLLAAGPLSRWMGEPAIAALLPVLALRIPLELAAAVPNAMIVRSMKFKMVALRTTIATSVSVVLTLSLLWAGYGYWALAISQVCASLVICVIGFWASGWRPGIEFDLGALRELTGYGLFASGTRMLTTMRLDQIVLGALGGTALLGLYFFAQRFYMMLTQLVGGALSSVTHALLSTLQSDQEKTRQAFGIASFAAGCISLPMFTLLALLAPDVMAVLFDPQWQEASIAVQMFCIIGCIAGISVVQGAFIRSQGRADWWFWYQCLQQLSSIVVILLTYRAGLQTMMIAIIIKSLLVWPVSVVMTTKLLGTGLFAYLRAFIAPAAATVAMTVAVLGLPYLLPGMLPLEALILRWLAAGLIYTAVLSLLAYPQIKNILRIISSKRETAA
ncbi:lipopolysaccharide biosynthesis protein (plasmid) [Qingshengfaniella alkalisoli]|uniref:Lipopolysaccharide biosynthesis protein n=2 Tax=Qingshengfaniella alkalisoli TaxID=2599296 RepID=A0A5B8IAW3_9RHOB|nr:lipopolysaccharide biosynthesis protein [Qingshengfaniella alkalisoli]